MYQVLSTYRVVKEKALDEPISEVWVDWAIEMMEAGFESINLYILAGQLPPYNQFELRDLTDKIFADLKIDFSDKEIAVRNYLYYLISTSLDVPGRYINVLREIQEIYLGYNFGDCKDFYLLYCAKTDLEFDEVQWYWDGANRNNIDRVIKEYFEHWLTIFHQDAKKKIT